MLIVVECDTGLIETVAHVTNVLQGAQDSSVTCRGTEPLSRPNLITNSKRGQPYYEVHKEQIEYLLQVQFNCPEIAMIVGVSLSTIRRRMALYGLSIQSLYSIMSDDELDEVIKDLHCLPQLRLQDDGRTPAQSRVQITSSVH